MRCRIIAIGVALFVAQIGNAMAQETRQVSAGPEYAASPMLERWFGEGYRAFWTTPFSAPVLNLSTEAGGLEPVRQVGQLQTPGLALRGADGNSYTFRSLHKEPERILPPEWRRSWPAKLLRDATSATHPGAAVMLPVLYEAAGIPHTTPRLVVMADDPKLGQFRQTFANQVGTFEEFPTPTTADHEGFEHATEIVSTAELWQRWLQGPQNRIDSKAFLRARILDLFVENYDRRRGQWRWMRIPGKPAWQVLPEDPDMAFVRHNGVVATSMRGRQPRLLEFSGKYASRLEGPMSLGAEVDHWLLSDLDGSAFESTARELQTAWSDAVIDRAVAQLPAEWRRIDDGHLADALKRRRTALVDYVRRVYRYLARKVDVELTDLDERIAITNNQDGSTTVSVTASGADAPYYQRRFARNETKEIRVYVRGGNDAVVRSGKGGGIRVRVIADGGAKSVESADAHTEVWTDNGTVNGRHVSMHAGWKNPAPISDAPWLEPRNFSSWTIASPTLLYSTDVGIIAGASLIHTSYGFRTVPASKQQTLYGGWAFGESSGKVGYHGIFRRPASALGYDVRAFASGIEQINFYGVGNESPEERRRSRFRSQQTVILFSPALRASSSIKWSATVGPEVRSSNSGNEPGSILFEQQPYGVGRFNSVALRGRFQLDTRAIIPPSLVSVATGQAGDAPEQPSGRGVRAFASAFVAPAVWDVQHSYGGIDSYLAGFVGGKDVQLAARVGGQHAFGDYPWFDAAFLGGLSDRGYHSHRFAGDTSLYGNVELRTLFGGTHFASIFPVRFGVMAFVDDGRVWVPGESSNTWHASEGAGLLLKPLGTQIMLRATVAHSVEGTLFSAGSGFRF